MTARRDPPVGQWGRRSVTLVGSHPFGTTSGCRSRGELIRLRRAAAKHPARDLTISHVTRLNPSNMIPMPALLIVDGDRASQGALAGGLRDAGWECVVVQSMKEAVDALERTDFDVVLVDEVLPDGGSALLEATVARYSRPKQPSFVCVADLLDLAAVDDPERFPRNRRVLVKPFTWRQALPALEEALRSRRDRPPKRMG